MAAKRRSLGPRVFKPAQKKASAAGIRQLFDISGWSADGRGVARDKKGVTFIAGALPGEQVVAKVTQQRSRFSEAELVEVTQASDQRTQPLCPHANECGGCNAQHITHEAQIALKQAAALEQLSRLGKMEPQTLLPPVTSNPWHYRGRCRLAVNYRGSKVSVGFRAQQSSDIIDVTECRVLPLVLSALIAPLRQWLLNSVAESKAVSHIELLVTEDRPVAVLRILSPLTTAATEALAVLAADTGLDVWLKPNKGAQLCSLHGRIADPRYQYALADQAIKVQFSPLDFTQINYAVNCQMVSLALELLAPKPCDRVLDLFCGVGNFSLPLARITQEVIAIEAVESMVARGRENALLNGLDNIQFVAEDLSQSAACSTWHKAGIDLALLDPPRAGALEAIGYLLNLKPRTVVYVSCNPATFARDAAVLIEGGYSLTHFGVLDMFPQTAHIEAIAKFSYLPANKL